MQDIVRMGARIRAARKAAGFQTAKSFLKKHKFPASTFSQHESGSRIPDDDTLKFYCDTFEVNFDWLKEGKGQPYKKINNNQKQVMAEELTDLKRLHPKKSSIDKDLLKKILTHTIKKSNVKIAVDKIQLIVNTTVEIYSEHPQKKKLSLKNIS